MAGHLVRSASSSRSHRSGLCAHCCPRCRSARSALCLTCSVSACGSLTLDSSRKHKNNIVRMLLYVQMEDSLTVLMDYFFFITIIIVTIVSPTATFDCTSGKLYHI